jgi:acetyltransferase-like isoleucine patch superfamily enzyme
VGPYVKILTGTHRIKNAKFRRDPSEELVVGDVLISKGTWIGMNVSILPNVVISSGCVVGASSLVIRNTEEDGLYCGVPAILIKKLPIN